MPERALMTPVIWSLGILEKCTNVVAKDEETVQAFEGAILSATAVAGGLTMKIKALLLEAVDHALAGDWQRAHVLVQEHEEEPVANWIHAVVHRMEGDEGNAQYWYGRCGRTYRPELSTAAELADIRATILE